VDRKISAGIVKQDRREIARALGVGKVTALARWTVEEAESSFTKGRQLTSDKLKAFVDRVDQQIQSIGPTLVHEAYRPGTRVRPRLEAYERLAAHLVPYDLARRDGTEIRSGGFLIDTIRIFASRKLVECQVTETGIDITQHAMIRALEREGLETGDVYSSDESPTHAMALAVIEQAGLAALYKLRAAELDHSIDVFFPTPRGFLLGDVRRPTDDEAVGWDGYAGRTKISGTKVTQHPLFPIRTEIVFATFVADLNAFPQQTELKRRFLRFIEEHRSALKHLGRQHLWRTTALFDVADATAVAAARMAFIPLAGAVQRLPSPRNIGEVA
jgi:hypothetical protein